MSNPQTTLIDRLRTASKDLIDNVMPSIEASDLMDEAADALEKTGKLQTTPERLIIALREIANSERAGRERKIAREALKNV